jgi:hypothetical protein
MGMHPTTHFLQLGPTPTNSAFSWDPINGFMQLGMVVQACSLSTQEAEAGGWKVPGQPGLYSEIRSQKKKSIN